jgi:hypothetical protein
MNRRELFRLLTAGALVPALSPDVFALFREAQTTPGYTLRTLTPHQNDIVLQMIDIIVPATATPGAKGARVNEFIDVILTDWALPPERDKFMQGLAQVDPQSNELFGKTFLEAAPAQQVALLNVLDDGIEWNESPQATAGVTLQNPHDGHLEGEFFRVLKTMTLHGYYTSEIGFTQELKLEIIPGAQHGCAPLPEEKKA